MNLEAVEDMKRKFAYLDLIFVESGGDNLAASFSPELVDASAYVLSPATSDRYAECPGLRERAIPNLCAVRVLTHDAHTLYRLLNDTRALARQHLNLFAPARTVL
jgi:hypothetical protein